MNLSNIKNVQLINTEVVKGGKRNGIIQAGSREGRRFLRQIQRENPNARIAAQAPGTMTHYINDRGEEICIEW
jgi:hypothetical protein